MAIIEATNNPQKNIQQVQTQNQTVQTNNNIEPVTIPVQIQPVVANTQGTQQTQQVQKSIPTPVEYSQPTQNLQSNYQNVFDNYQSQYKTQIEYPNIQVPFVDINTMEGQYQSNYSNAINQIANQILSARFSYNPNEDDLLKQASKYVTQNTFESMNSKGILNSSLTAERVAQVVGELIPQYEKLAREEFDASFSRLLNTANLLMNMDERQFAYWKDARDQKWKEEEQEYQRKQDELENAWKRVDELGYVDNAAASILGVSVGTLSKDAREAKEAYERQIKEWNRQHEIEKQTEIELYKLKQEMSGTTSSKNSVTLNTYNEIIRNRWAEYDEVSNKYSVNNNAQLWNYLTNEYVSGRMTENDYASLIAMYNVTEPTAQVVAIKDNVIYVKKDNGQYTTLTVTPNATKEQVLAWGNEQGVDLSKYMN